MAPPIQPPTAPSPLQATYDALAKEMTDANKDLQAQVAAAKKQAADALAGQAQSQAAYSELSASNAAVVVENSTLLGEKVKLQADLAAALEKLSKVPPIYQNIPGRCIAVLPRKGSICPNCGWQFEGTRIQDKEPHIVA